MSQPHGVFAIDLRTKIVTFNFFALNVCALLAELFDLVKDHLQLSSSYE